MRLVFVAREQSLRLGSAVSRGIDFVDEVVVISLGEDEKQREMVEKAGGIFVVHEGLPHAPSIARTLLAMDLPETDNTVAIGLDRDWKLKNLPRHIALARSRNDIYIAFKHRSVNQRTEKVPESSEAITIASYSYEDAAISVCAFTKEGLRALSKANDSDKPADLPRELRVRIIELENTPVRKELESLTSASRFAQLFYWMLESKHPLIVLGIPGIVFFTVGYKMATALIDVGGPHDTVSIGVALAAFAVTFIGVLSLVSGLVLYILGKQIDKVQLEYS